MHHVAEALVALGGAFLVCGLLARLGVPIGLPTIPLFMLAGVVLGPHTPGFDLVDDPAELELVARLGLVFLLFYLGLEFSLDQLISGGRRLAAAAAVYLVLDIHRRLGNPETRVILGIVVIEDLFLAFYLAMLQPVLGGASGPPTPPSASAPRSGSCCCCPSSPASARGG